MCPGFDLELDRSGGVSSQHCMCLCILPFEDGAWDADDRDQACTEKDTVKAKIGANSHAIKAQLGADLAMYICKCIDGHGSQNAG